MNITDIFKEDNKVMSLSEQRLREAEQRKWGLESSNPYLSEEKYNGVNAKIAGDSYYNPDECVKQAMIKFQTQGEQAIKAVKVRREGQGQFMCTEKDIADIKAQFPEGKRNVAGPGPLKIMRMRRIKKWCGAICCFNVEESQIGYFNEKRTVYTLNDVRVFFYHKNSDGIGSEIILKNKFMRLRKRAGKSKDIKSSKESVDPTKSEEGIVGIIGYSLVGLAMLASLGITISDKIKDKRDAKLKQEMEKNKQSILEMKKEIKNSDEAKKIKNAIETIVNDAETIFDGLKDFPVFLKRYISKKNLNDKFNNISENIIKSCMIKSFNKNKIKAEILEDALKTHNVQDLKDLNKIKSIEYYMYLFDGEKFLDDIHDDDDAEFEPDIYEDAFEAYIKTKIASHLSIKNIDYNYSGSYSVYAIRLTQKI